MSGIGPISGGGPVNLGGVGAGDLASGMDNGAAPTANRAYLAKFQVFAPITVTKAFIAIQVQSGNVDAGIYDAATLRRLASTGSTACPAAGPRSINLTAAVTLVPGRVYYQALVADNATVRWVAKRDLAAGLSSPGYANLNGVVSTAFPLPDPIGTVVLDTTTDVQPALSFTP